MTYYPPDQTKFNGVLQKGPKSLFTLSSSPAVQGFEVSKILNTEDSYFHSQYLNHPNICVSFESFFLIRSYSIMSRYTFTTYFPKRWKVEGSHNKIKWHDIDERDTDVLTGNSYKENFPVKHIGSYKHIKITLIETHDHNKGPFTIGALDLFGKLMNTGFAFNESIKKKNLLRFNILGIILIIISR